MAMTKYTANFEACSAERIYGKPLTHAWRVEYCVAGSPDQTGVKSGFSSSREAAEKATKLPKRLKATKVEIVECKAVETVAKAPAKPKKVKPFAKGETVFIVTGEAAILITARVKSMRGDTVTLTVPGILNDIRVKTTDVRKRCPDPAPLAQAA